jgi:putative flippase GtrA
MVKEMIRFGIAGAIATIFAMFSFPFLYEDIFFRRYFTIAYVLSSALNVSLSFSLQRYFVFKSRGPLFNEFLKFTLGALFLIILGYMISYVFIEFFLFNAYVVNIVVVAATSISSFLWHKVITFGVNRDCKNNE